MAWVCTELFMTHKMTFSYGSTFWARGQSRCVACVIWSICYVCFCALLWFVCKLTIACGKFSEPGARCGRGFYKSCLCVFVWVCVSRAFIPATRALGSLFEAHIYSRKWLWKSFLMAQFSEALTARLEEYWKRDLVNTTTHQILYCINAVFHSWKLHRTTN